MAKLPETTNPIAPWSVMKAFSGAEILKLAREHVPSAFGPGNVVNVRSYALKRFNGEWVYDVGADMDDCHSVVASVIGPYKGSWKHVAVQLVHDKSLAYVPASCVFTASDDQIRASAVYLVDFCGFCSFME